MAATLGSNTETNRRAPAVGGLGETRALLDAVLQNDASSIIIVDEAAIIRYVSSGTEALLGYDAHSLVGTSAFDYLHPEDSDAALHRLTSRLGLVGRDLGSQLRIRDATGSFLAVTITASALPSGSIGALAIAIDSDVRPTAEQRLLRQRLIVEEFCNRLSANFMGARTSEEALGHISTSVAEIGLLSRAESVAVFVEHEDERIQRVARWVHPSHADQPSMDSVEIALDPSLIEHALTRFALIDDLPSRGTTTATPITDTTHVSSVISAPFDAGPQRGFVLFLRYSQSQNWTDADAQLCRGAAKLYGRALRSARVEELLKLTYDTSPTGMSIRTWDGQLVDCNQQYLKLHAISRETAERSRLGDVLHPGDHAWVIARMGELERREIDQIHHDARIRRPDGEIRWVRVTSVALEVPWSSDTYVLTSLEDVTENHAQRQDLEFAAAHDPLTRVANRSTMHAAIAEFEAHHSRLPNILVIDLDRFKLVNDSLGHVAGDAVLKAFVQRITDMVREQDLVARLGGDEFAVVVADPRPAAAEKMAERLRRSMEEPLDIDGRLTRQSVSVGVAMGDACSESAQLLVQADRAMYAAKANGRNCYVVFDESMHDEALARLGLERELRHAVDHDEFELYFQPIFDLEDRSIRGAEALIRWSHPKLGVLSAGHFMDVAEKSGLMDEIGRYALREACRSFADLTSRACQTNLTLSINVSGREFARPELADLVFDALFEAGLAPDRLCIEMTETTFMDARDVALETFTRLNELGVKFAIDDFGTGYSSLIYLKRFPVDILKIDHSFVEDIATNADSAAIVESIIGLGRALSLEIIAEGIESDEQHARLAGLGCPTGQGFLVSPAVDAAEFLELLGGPKAAVPWTPLQPASDLIAE